MSKLKTVIKKALCAVLAIIICLSPALVTGVSAVTYPDGLTAADCEAVIPKLDAAIPELLKLTGTDLDAAVYGALITDGTLNDLFRSVYSELAGNSSTLSLMGVTLTPQSLSAALSEFPGVSNKIAACGSMEEVIAACGTFEWGIHTKDGFAYAAAAMFSPFNTLLNAVLCGGTAQINILLAIKGDDGYGNTIVPLLKAMNCPSIMSSADFAAASAQDRNSMVSNIVKMLFASVDNILAHPGEGICSTLPSLAWYINSGKLSEAVKALTDPLALRIGIVTIPGITKLLGSIASLEGMDISSMIGDIDISKMTGNSNDTLQLPDMDMAALAACGTASGDTFTPDKPAALVTVAGWLVKTVKLNAAKMTEDDPDAAALITPLTEKSDDELVKAFILLLKPDDTAYPNPFVWSYPEHTKVTASATPTLTMDDYQKVLDEIDPFLDEVAAEKDPDSTIKSVITPVIYSNSLLGTLVSAVYSAIGSEETAPLFGMLGMDVSTAGIASVISGSHRSAASTIRSAENWSDITATSLDFGFEDGDRDGFREALTDVLAPFTPLLRYLLAEGKLTILGTIELNGSDGYNSAVIPLLEALGCPAGSIKTYAQYKETADTSALTDILEPILALLDKICEKPVYTVCSILPNLLWFLNGDGIKNCISNLIYPLTAKLEQVGLSDILPADLLNTEELDINSAAEKLLASSELQIKLPAPNLNKLIAFGEETTLVSKRTADGAETVYTYIKADGPSVLLTILRYLVDTLSLEENSEVLSGFMGSVMSSSSDEEQEGPDMMAMYAGSIGEKFKGMTTDEIIEWLYDLLFRETPKVELADEYIPTVIYEKEEKHSKASGLILALVIIAAVTALFIFLDKKGKLDPIKEKHRAKREKKLFKKEERIKNSKRLSKKAAKKAAKKEARAKKKGSGKLSGKDKKNAKKELAEKKAAGRAAVKAARKGVNDETDFADIMPVLKPAEHPVTADAPSQETAGKTDAPERKAPSYTPVRTSPEIASPVQTAENYRDSLIMPLSGDDTITRSMKNSGRQAKKAPERKTAKAAAKQKTPAAPAAPQTTVNRTGYTPKTPDPSLYLEPEMLMQPVVTSIPMTEKRAAKLNKRQRKAAELAIKRRQKSDEYYKQAIAAASNQKSSKGGRK